ncbi:lipopolysaccharide biosynthesis protein [Sphingomonas sp. Tas61C01]|uniref:lipopolysaccharide biosynthesis protein n=1 Tax=Sphingomonas sp. Tas61C01 TaxID=3458297 RepID=UPI00403EE8C7
MDDNRSADSATMAVPARSRVRANVIANYVGRGWATVIGIICLPFFLALLGREAYGLIGAFAVVQAWALLLDFGLTPTLNREVVRARSGMRSWRSLSDLVRTIELLLLALGLLIAIVVTAAAPMLATVWLKPDKLPTDSVAYAITIMGVLAAMRWVEQVYRGALQGGEDQVWLNLVQIATETARWAGALAVIALVRADVLLFFGWNVLVSLLSVLLLRRRMNAFLSQHVSEPARLSLTELHAVRAFAGGMFLSSILVFLLTQADKLIVGNHVPLADFGIYALAATAASGLLQLVQPMTVAILPRLTTLVEARRPEELVAMFHAASQWLALMVLPIGLLVIALPERALIAWTGQAGVATSGASVLALLMTASVLNALANPPYILQLAHGWTALTNKVNAGAILVAVPVMNWATVHYAGLGAAATLVALNLVALTVTSLFVMARLLPRQILPWFFRSVLAPCLAGAGVLWAFRCVVPMGIGRWRAIADLVLAGGTTAAAILCVLPLPRDRMLAYLRRHR